MQSPKLCVSCTEFVSAPYFMHMLFLKEEKLFQVSKGLKMASTCIHLFLILFDDLCFHYVSVILIKQNQK